MQGLAHIRTTESRSNTRIGCRTLGDSGGGAVSDTKHKYLRRQPPAEDRGQIFPSIPLNLVLQCLDPPPGVL